MIRLFSNRNQDSSEPTDHQQLSQQLQEIQAKLQAVRDANATIEFEPDGTIVDANDHFLATMKYSLSEIQGKHHHIFVDPAYKSSAEYREFWAALRCGKPQVREFKRFNRNGQAVWIQASYMPVFGPDRSVVRVIKHATDITDQKLQSFVNLAKLEAISRSQAVIEFELDGTIIDANENFQTAMGYSLAEIRGKHHSIFVPPADRDSQAYQEFWNLLRKGEFQSGQFQRLGKGNREVWIQATYNPIFDSEGVPQRIVKFATDITKQIQLRQQVTRVGDSVIESSGQMVSTIHEISSSVNRTANLASSTEQLART
ncbi:MAG: PAS domain-containing protein, partial [Pirellulales bacterium]|nr:PAS domain-containing protein [Pirellulales bacterium]